MRKSELDQVSEYVLASVLKHVMCCRSLRIPPDPRLEAYSVTPP